MASEELVLTNRDGRRMPSTLRTPEQKPCGTVILLHGLGGLRDQQLITQVAQGLATAGYNTFAFDDSHGVKSLDARFFESTPTKSIRDTEDAIAYVKQQPWFTPPLVLLGHSMGGFSAVHHARHHPYDVQRLILLAPAMSWKTLWGAAVPILLLWFITGSQKVLSIDENHEKLGRAWVRDFIRYDAHRDAPYITIPTLIVSADRDETVARPSEHARFARKFPNASHITIQKADHDFDGREWEVVGTIRAWLTPS